MSKHHATFLLGTSATLEGIQGCVDRYYRGEGVVLLSPVCPPAGVDNRHDWRLLASSSGRTIAGMRVSLQNGRYSFTGTVVS